MSQTDESVMVTLRRVHRGWLVKISSGEEFVFEDTEYFWRTKKSLERAVERVVATFDDLDVGSEIIVLHTKAMKL